MNNYRIEELKTILNNFITQSWELLGTVGDIRFILFHYDKQLPKLSVNFEKLDNIVKSINTLGVDVENDINRLKEFIIEKR